VQANVRGLENKRLDAVSDVIPWISRFMTACRLASRNSPTMHTAACHLSIYVRNQFRGVDDHELVMSRFHGIDISND